MTVQDPLQAPGAQRSDGRDFGTAMAHLYRGEIQRMTVWRTRLDTTTNWAIVLSFGVTTFALGDKSAPHSILLLAIAIITVCLLFEARRYQHLLHSKWRVALMEQSYFAHLLDGTLAVNSNWRRELAADLQEPRYGISLFLSIRLRLRRNYLMLIYIIAGVWLTKLAIHPGSPRSAQEFYARLAIGSWLSSGVVAAAAASLIIVATVLAALTPSQELIENQPGSRAGS